MINQKMQKPKWKGTKFYMHGKENKYEITVDEISIKTSLLYDSIWLLASKTLEVEIVAKRLQHQSLFLWQEE